MGEIIARTVYEKPEALAMNNVQLLASLAF